MCFYFIVFRHCQFAYHNIILGMVNFLMSVTLAIGSIIASKEIFEHLISNVLRNPLSFFDITPNGRILNRLGKDIDTIDNVLPGILRMWVTCFFSVWNDYNAYFVYGDYLPRVCEANIKFFNFYNIFSNISRLKFCFTFYSLIWSV